MCGRSSRIAILQALLSLLRFANMQRYTSWRFGIADQHTLNASLMHACRWSEVSARTGGHQKTEARPTTMGTSHLIELTSP